MSTHPTPHPRVIVLCFDGTSNQFSAQNTNVVKFYGLLDKCCPLQQIVYYQPGIGTYINPGVVSPALGWIAKIADQAFAWYLNQHVMGGYQFLMDNYRSGDKICIFGFSRGAYTARALAGFLFKIGLLPRDNIEQVPFAYSLYTRTDKAGKALAIEYKQTFCTAVTIDFLGVWDTVASVGLIFGRSLPFTSANSAVRVFRHALSLDEHRARFQPNAFHRESPKDAARRREDPSLPVESETLDPEVVERPHPHPKHGHRRWGVTIHRHAAKHEHPGANHRAPGSHRARGLGSSPPGPSSTVLLSLDPVPPVLEVWFAGCHSDVGGSAIKDTVRYSLAAITLRWMVKQVILAQCGIRFDEAALRRADIDISNLVSLSPTQLTMDDILDADAGTTVTTSLPSPSLSGEYDIECYMVRSRNDGEVVEQDWPRKQDVVADIHDELRISPIWWLLEFLPIKYEWQDPKGAWKYKWGINLGRGRKIRDPRPIFHDSVRERMATVGLNYKPRARWPPGTERYVD
ncbi:hypothetical protein BJ322DRAFT_136244 [Thelephora terrestris]|uniref:T6SS Phospholipase effector Tle1-like catalytic domain-containing protein n=1 Tax=Thelephora terrestris TaxID=56493 RepID=A0A9P6HBD2_9AGAM|nr:hypothetical protein BJ322DRAFT_136244 [Thelephora terrestris]